MAKRKRKKGQTMIYKTKDWATRTHNQTGAQVLTVPAPLETPIVLLLNDTNIIWYDIL